MRTYRFGTKTCWLTKDGMIYHSPWEAYLGHLGEDQIILVYEDEELIKTIDPLPMLEAWRKHLFKESYVTEMKNFIDNYVIEHSQ